jgi:hypothetical protein
MSSDGGFADARLLREAVKGAGYHRSVFWSPGQLQIAPGGKLTGATGAFYAAKPPKVTGDDVVRFPMTRADGRVIGQITPSQAFDTVTFAHAGAANTPNSHRFHVVRHEEAQSDGSVTVRQMAALTPLTETEVWHAAVHASVSGFVMSLKTPDGRMGDRVDVSGLSSVTAFASREFHDAHPHKAPPVVFEACSAHKPVKPGEAPSQAYRTKELWNRRFPDKPLTKVVAATEDVFVWNGNHTYEVAAPGVLTEVGPPDTPTAPQVWLADLAANSVDPARVGFTPGTTDLSDADKSAIRQTAFGLAQTLAWRAMRGHPSRRSRSPSPRDTASKSASTPCGRCCTRSWPRRRWNSPVTACRSTRTR